MVDRSVPAPSKANLSELYGQLLRQADKAPVKALESWLVLFDAQAAYPRSVLATHRRALERLIARASAGAGAGAEEKTVAALARAARERLAKTPVKPRSSTEPLPPLTLTPTREGPMSEISSAGPDAFCPPDLLRLQKVAQKWASADFIKWLADGFAALQDSGRQSHLAFAPLRLYPMGRFAQQLAASISEAAEFHLPVAEAIIKAIRRHLTSGRPALAHGHRLDVQLWTLYAQFKVFDPRAEIPASYLDHALRQVRKDTPDLEPLLDVITDTVFETVPSPSRQAWFFERAQRAVVSPTLDAALAIALLNEAQRDIGSDQDAVVSAATRCKRLIGDRGGAVEAKLVDLLSQGRLFDEGRQAFSRPVGNVLMLRTGIERLARAGEVTTAKQPVPIKLEETWFAAAMV